MINKVLSITASTQSVKSGAVASRLILESFWHISEHKSGLWNWTSNMNYSSSVSLYGDSIVQDNISAVFLFPMFKLLSKIISCQIMIDSQLIQESYCETLIFHFHILIGRTNLLLCFAAVLFVTSAPARLGESLHLGKHCQQRVSPRNYNSIRWGDYLILHFDLHIHTAVYPQSHPSALPIKSVLYFCLSQLTTVYTMKWNQSFLHICSMFEQQHIFWGNAPSLPFCTQVWSDLSWPALTSAFSSHLTLETHGERYSTTTLCTFCAPSYSFPENSFIFSVRPEISPSILTHDRKLDFISALSEWKAGEQNKECDSASNAIFQLLSQKK